MRILLVSLTLVAAPMAAMAMCSERHASMSCEEGTVWDEASKTCIVASS